MELDELSCRGVLLATSLVLIRLEWAHLHLIDTGVCLANNLLAGLVSQLALDIRLDRESERASDISSFGYLIDVLKVAR